MKPARPTLSAFAPLKGPALPLEATTPRASIRCLHLAPAVLLYVVDGYGDAEAANRVVEWDESASVGGPLHIFHDWRGMTGYESVAREKLSRHVEHMGPRLLSGSILLRSRIMAMGVQVANMMLHGRLVTFSDPAAFAAAIAKCGVDPARLAEAGF